jgi:hypothetical protein
MPCCSGCCGPSPKPSEDIGARGPPGGEELEQVTGNEGHYGHGDAVRPVHDASSTTDGHQVETEAATPIESGLKSSQDSATHDMPAAACEDGCCDDVNTQDDCYGITGTGKPEAPPCCKDKPSPCCDTACLDRLALRACEDEKQQQQHTATSESYANGDLLPSCKRPQTKDKLTVTLQNARAARAARRENHAVIIPARPATPTQPP